MEAVIKVLVEEGNLVFICGKKIEENNFFFDLKLLFSKNGLELISFNTNFSTILFEKFLSLSIKRIDMEAPVPSPPTNILLLSFKVSSFLKAQKESFEENKFN